ncbi:hypothetical protein Tco_0426314 [Tanacetum coccineum]
MEILSRLKDIKMMRMKTKNPPLDQTGGPREEEQEKNLNQLVHQRKRLPNHQARLNNGPNLIICLLEFDTRFTKDQTVDETTQHPDWFQKPTKPPTPDRDWNKTLLAKHGLVQPWIRTLAQNEDPLTKTKAADYGHIKWIEELVPNTMWINRESAHDVYSRNKIIRIKKLMIVEWHNYKHLEWITICKDYDKLYTFKEGDYNRLRLHRRHAASSYTRQADKS